MSQKVTQGKSGVVGPKKSEQLTISHGVVGDSQNKSGPNETEPLSSEMETVIIQGTDFAKEFEKPNDRASHIKIGRAKQKIVGNQGTILQCTSVNVTSSNNKSDGKLNVVAQKTTVAQSVETAAKKNDGPCRTSDLEGSAASSCSAVKTNCKKAGSTTVPVTTSCTITAASVRKDGNFVGRGNVQLINTSCITKGKILTRPAPIVPPPLRPNDNSKTMRRTSGFSNMRPVVPNPGNIFPGSTPRVRNPGSNFNPPRPGVCVQGNLYGRPNVPMANVRNARQIGMVNRFNTPRSVGGILVRPSGSPLMQPTCPGTKGNQLVMSSVSNIVNQKIAGSNKQNVKANSNTITTTATSTSSTTTTIATTTTTTTTINNVNIKNNVTFANTKNKTLVSDGNSVKANSGKNLVKSKPESNKVISETKIQVNTSNSTLDLDVAKKISNNNKSANVGANKTSENSQLNVASSSSTNKSNSIVKVASSTAVHTVPPSSSSITNDKLITTTTTTTTTNTATAMKASPKPSGTISTSLPNSTPVASVSGQLQSSSTETKEKEQHPPDSTGAEESCDVLDDSEGSKSAISFSFCRKMGQKLSSSVPFGKERDEKLLHSGESEREPKESKAAEETSDSVEKGDAEKSAKSSEEKSAAKDLPPPGMPFLKVLNKEQTLELDWPVEMIQYTKTQPPITYSCNPLFFDFSELLPKNKSQKSDDASKTKVKGKSDEMSTGKVEVNSFTNKDELKESKLARKSKKKRKLSTQHHSDDEPKAKKKKKKKHKKKEHKTEEGVSGKDDNKNVSVESGKNKRHKKKKKRSHQSGTKSDTELGDGGEAVRNKSSHKSKHKKHKSRKSKKKRHKSDEFEKQSQSGHESEEETTGSYGIGLKNKQLKKRKSQLKSESGNISSEEETASAATDNNGSKVTKVHKTKVKLVGVERSELPELESKQSTAATITTAISMGEEEKPDVCKKRPVSIGTSGPLFESMDDSKKIPKEETVCVKAGSSSERKRHSGDIDSPSNSKRKASKNPCIKSEEDTWSKMENLFEARFDPEGNKASWDTSSDSDVESPVNSCLKSKNNSEVFKRKKNDDESIQTDKKEINKNSNNSNNSNSNNNNNSNNKSAFSSSKVDSRNENYHQSSGSDTDQPSCSVQKSYKRKKCYSGESHHSESQCRSREHSYSSSYSDRDSHYSDKSKHRHSRSHSSSNSRSRSRSRSVSYERHGSHRGRRYSYSSYSEDDYRYRRRRTASRSCSRHRSRTRSSSYSHSRRYRSYSSEHRSYTSSSSRSRSRSESRGRSRSYSYSRSHSKSSSYSRSRSRSRSYHKSHSKSRSPHKSKSDYRHKSSPEPRYSSSYSTKKYSQSLQSKKSDNDKSGKLDPAKIPMPGDIKDGGSDQQDKSKGKSSAGESTKSGTSVSEASTATTSAASKADPTGQSNSSDAKPSSGGLKNIPLPPFQVAEAAHLTPDNQTRPPPPPPQLIPPPRFPAAANDNLLHPLPDLSQPPPSAALIPNCPPPPPPPPPPLNVNMPALPPTRMGAPSLYGHLSLPTREAAPMNVPPPPPPPRTQLPFTPRSVTRLEQTKDGTVVVKPAIEQNMQSLSATPSLLPLVVEAVEKEMTPPLPPPKSPPPQPPPPPKKEDEKKSCEDISPMPLPIIPPEQAEQYKHLQEMAQKHALKQQRRQHQKETGQVEESDDDESMEMEGQVSTVVSDEETDEQPGILALPEPEPQHLQQQILLPQAQHAGSPVIAHHPMVPFSQQQQIMIPPNALLQSQGTFPIQAGGPVIAIPQMSHGAAHHHHPHHALAGHHALHHHLHATAGLPIAAAAHPFHHQLIAAPSQLMPLASPQPLLTQIHPPGSIIIGHQVYIPRFPRAI